MAYSFAWDETYPPDSELANLLAQNQRRIEQNIRERMDDVFTDPSGTWAASGPANPVVPSALLKGNFTGKVISFHHSAFTPDSYYASGGGFPGTGFAVSTVNRTSQYVQGNSNVTTLSYFCPIVLPVAAALGVTITSVTFALDLVNTSNTFTGKISYFPLNTGVVVVLNSANAPSVTGFNQFTLSAGSLPFNTAIGGGTSAVLFLEINTTVGFLAQAPKLYGAQVVYNAADSRATV